jgi:hypothetical protein
MRYYEKFVKVIVPSASPEYIPISDKNIQFIDTENEIECNKFLVSRSQLKLLYREITC